MRILWWLCGANKADYPDHVELGRDFEINEWKDLLLQEGDICPEWSSTPCRSRCWASLSSFLAPSTLQLLIATFTDENGEDVLVMGRYGIGVPSGATNDEKGIMASLCCLMKVSALPLTKIQRLGMAGAVADACVAAGLETVVDDRAERSGVKFPLASHGRLLWARRALQTVSQKSKSVLPGERFEVALMKLPLLVGREDLPERGILKYTTN